MFVSNVFVFYYIQNYNTFDLKVCPQLLSNKSKNKNFFTCLLSHNSLSKTCACTCVLSHNSLPKTCAHAYSSTTVCQKSRMTEILTFYNWHSGRLSYESTRVHNIEVFGLTDRLGGKEAWRPTHFS